MPRPILPEVMKARAGVPISDLLALLWAKKLQGYSITTITGIPPLSFRADGRPLISWSMLGNGQQTGTPTPDNPITPDFVGTLDGTDWSIPITSAGQTRTVYLGQVPTTRRIKKLVLDGTENWQKNDASPNNSLYYLGVTDKAQADCICTHFQQSTTTYPANNQISGKAGAKIIYIYLAKIIIDTMPSGNTKEGFKEYLAAQYANGTPVTVWYVLATPTTGIVNEPLAKIGTYADELHSEDAGITIPTVNGETTLTVETELQPSSVTITGNIKQT